MKASVDGHIIAQSEDIVACHGYQYFPQSAVRLDWLQKTEKTADDLVCPHGVQFYDVVDSIPPGYFGGNMDNWRIGKGATMYYPVAVPGGLFSVGDSHAAQGDSELCGTAIEMSLTGTFQLVLHKKDKLTGSLAGLNYPLLETQDEWVLHGFSFANYLEELGPTAQQDIYKKSSIDLALRDAFR